MSESDFVARVRAVAKEMTTLGQAFDMLHVADELERRDAEIERLRAAGDALADALRSGSDREWDKAIDDWQEARREG